MSAKSDASRRGEKILNVSREKKIEARTVVGRAGNAYFVTPDLSYEREKAGESNATKNIGQWNRKLFF